MNTSSTTIIFFFLSSFFFTFSSARVPFQIQFHRTDSKSLSKNKNSDPIQLEPQPQPQPKPKPAHRTRDRSPIETSNPLPFTVITFEPRVPRHAMPMSSRLEHRHYQPWKPRRRGQDFHSVARGGVRHVARGWTRFGLVEPTLLRQRGKGMQMERGELLRRVHHREQEIKHARTGFVKRIRKFLNQF